MLCSVLWCVLWLAVLLVVNIVVPNCNRRLLKLSLPPLYRYQLIPTPSFPIKTVHIFLHICVTFQCFFLQFNLWLSVCRNCLMRITVWLKFLCKCKKEKFPTCLELMYFYLGLHARGGQKSLKFEPFWQKKISSLFCAFNIIYTLRRCK